MPPIQILQSKELFIQCGNVILCDVALRVLSCGCDVEFITYVILNLSHTSPSRTTRTDLKQ